MYMTKYILKRVLLLCFTFFIIFTVCFVLIKMLPVPIVKVNGQDVNIILQRREMMGYNRPIMEQYAIYIQRIFQYGDFGVGEQMYISQEVAEVMKTKLPYTVIVNLYAMLISVPLGLLFGIYAALRKNKIQDHIISTAVMIFISVPSYVYAFLVQHVLCYKLGWFPMSVVSLEHTTLMGTAMFVSMLPAVFSLAFPTIAGLTRFSRAELSEVLTSDYLLLARTKGLSKSQSIVRHALRNAMVPILPMIIGEFVGILGGSLIIEQIFNIPGIGQLYITSITLRDYNFFMALTGFYTLIGLVAGIIIDLSYGFIDPRIRMGAK